MSGGKKKPVSAREAGDIPGESRRDSTEAGGERSTQKNERRELGRGQSRATGASGGGEKTRRTVREWGAKWLDDWKIALTGILLAARERLFWAWFLPVFFVFGILLNLLSSGTAAFALMVSGGFSVALDVVSKAFLGIFGVGRDFWDFLLVLIITILQATLIAEIAVVWRYNKMNAQRISDRRRARGASSGAGASDGAEAIGGAEAAREEKTLGDAGTSDREETLSGAGGDPNRDGMTIGGSLQNSGLVAGLALLSGGCPTCGTALLAPIITSVFSGGGFALAGVISGGLTVLALVLALYTLKKVGLDAYALIKAEKRRKRKARKADGGHKATNGARAKVVTKTSGHKAARAKEVAKTSERKTTRAEKVAKTSERKATDVKKVDAQSVSKIKKGEK